MRLLTPGWGAILALQAPITISAGKADKEARDVQKISLIQRSPQALSEAQPSLDLGILKPSFLQWRQDGFPPLMGVISRAIADKVQHFH